MSAHDTPDRLCECDACVAEDLALLNEHADPIAAVAAEWTTAHELVGQPPFQMMAEVVKRNGHMVGTVEYHDALRIRRSAGGHDGYWTASCQGVALQGQWKTRDEAAEATGLSPDTIDDAIRAGDLRANRPTINGRKIRTVLIAHDELARWIGAAS